MCESFRIDAIRLDCCISDDPCFRRVRQRDTGMPVEYLVNRLGVKPRGFLLR